MAEKIDGINISDLASEVENELLQAKRADVAKVIRAIYGDITRWEKERNDALKREIALTQKINGALAKLDKIKAGDWSVLPNLEGPAKETQE